MPRYTTVCLNLFRRNGKSQQQNLTYVVYEDAFYFLIAEGIDTTDSLQSPFWIKRMWMKWN